ncbi:MAG TPA: DUF4476 domain-containing protein [Candidatus Cloacimonadota bacterium]|nr:DUF4476 domain-containing protein [Candidatus Cloacimonadota bacterium]
MKNFILVILLLAGAMLLGAEINDDYEHDRGQYSVRDLSPEQQIILERIELRLDTLQNDLRGVLNKTEQRQLRKTIDELRELILIIAQPPVPRIYPMRKDDFNDLKQRIRNLAFPDDGLALLKTAASGNYFTSAQIAGLLDLFTFPDDKLKALSIAYPSCVDTSGNYKILDCFVFGDDKEKARQIIEK